MNRHVTRTDLSDLYHHLETNEYRLCVDLDAMSDKHEYWAKGLSCEELDEHLTKKETRDFLRSVHSFRRKHGLPAVDDDLVCTYSSRFNEEPGEVTKVIIG